MRNTDQVRTQRLRWYAFPLAARMTPFAGVEHDGVRYLVSTRDTHGVGRGTFAGGTFERETLRRMLTALERLGVTTLRGMTVLEVGANIGTETVSLLNHHGVKRVLAFERTLRMHASYEPIWPSTDCTIRVEIHEMALSDVDATLLLEHSAENWGDHRTRVGDVRGPDLYNERDRHTVEVPARRIDSLAEAGELDLDAVGLVWMDAQVMRGRCLRVCNGSSPPAYRS